MRKVVNKATNPIYCVDETKVECTVNFAHELQIPEEILKDEVKLRRFFYRTANIVDVLDKVEYCYAGDVMRRFFDAKTKMLYAKVNSKDGLNLPSVTIIYEFEKIPDDERKFDHMHFMRKERSAAEIRRNKTVNEVIDWAFEKGCYIDTY